MEKRRPIITTWYVKLILFVFIVLVVWLLGKSFMEGYREGRMLKQNEKHRQ